MSMEPVDYHLHHSSNEGSDNAGVQPPSVPSQSSGLSKVSRIRLNEVMEGPWTMEKVLDLWEEQDKYIDALEARVRHLGHRRENYLVMRLSSKEQELSDLSGQLKELKRLSGPPRSSLLDPALNLVLSRLKKELEAARTKMSETQEELSAWKFTPDSVTGKRLMSKCRQLLQENEDIGKMIASGRLSKLEAELAMQKTLAAKMKQNQLEMDEFVQELDEDVEGMQSTIYYLQQQLREAKEKLSSYEKKEEAKEPEEDGDDKRPNAAAAARGRPRKNKGKREGEEEAEESVRPKRRRNAYPKGPADQQQVDTSYQEEEEESASNPDSMEKQNLDSES